MAAMKKCLALYDYSARDAEELNISKNEMLTVVDDSGTWWRVGNDRGQTGLVPSNYVQVQASPSTGRSNVPSDDPHMYQQTDLMVSRNGPASLNIRAVAKYKYTSTREDELSLEKGDEVIVMEKEADGWWRGRCGTRIGWFPFNYVEELPDSALSGGQMGGGVGGGGGGGSPPQLQQQQPPSREKNFICGVVALYSFNSGNPEELPFEKGDLMDIIDQPPDDPDWWEARKPDGSTGLVPRNYVEVVHDADSVVGKAAGGGGGGGRPGLGGGLAGRGGMSGAMGSRAPPPFGHESWYYGRVPRRDAESILNSQAQNGQFIVRESETKVRWWWFVNV